MPVSASILVEGIDDEQFLQAYLKHLSFDSKQFSVGNVGGKDNTDELRKKAERAIDREQAVLVIFDANSDPAGARANISETLNGLSHSDFLFPDNQSEGNLENLLEKIINSTHGTIFECFEAYRECLKNCDPPYTIPSDKGKIYAYRQALNKLDKEDQFSPEIWDFDSEALEPLKNFLSQHLAQKP